MCFDAMDVMGDDRMRGIMSTVPSAFLRVERGKQLSSRSRNPL